MSEVGMIHEQICKVMADIGAIGKKKENTQQGFLYRGIDDVMNALNAPLSEHKVYIVPINIEELSREERTTKNVGNMFHIRIKVTYRISTSDGSFVLAQTIGEATDSGDKGTNKAMSIALKYLYFQLFCIPTEEMCDPDSESHDLAPKSKPQAKKEAKEESAPDVAKLTLDKNKIATIQHEIDRTGVPVKAVLARYKAENLEAITEKDFPGLMKSLQATPTKE